MNVAFFDKYNETPLLSFVENLVDDYYLTIERLCEKAGRQAERVRSLETDRTASQYTQFCNEVINGIGSYIQGRKEKYVPYVKELSEKVSTNHDCTACAGGCKANHVMQPLEIKATNDSMKKMVNKLQMVSLPLYSETLYPDEYRVLRNQMALLGNYMTELFFVENNYLVPKILEAQKNINVGS